MHRKRWIVAFLTAVVLPAGLALGAAPAAAAGGNGIGQACRYNYLTFNACLNIFHGTEPYRFSVIVGIDLRMPAGQAAADLRRGSSLRATLHSSHDYGSVVLPVRSGWPQAGPYVLSAQFGFDNMILDPGPGDAAFHAEIVFTEVHADGSTTVRTYRTGVLAGG